MSTVDLHVVFNIHLDLDAKDVVILYTSASRRKGCFAIYENIVYPRMSIMKKNAIIKNIIKKKIIANSLQFFLI